MGVEVDRVRVMMGLEGFRRASWLIGRISAKGLVVSLVNEKQAYEVCFNVGS